MEHIKDSVIIISGGMDSTTLLYDMKERIALGISFDYGSNHNEREIGFAKLHCDRLGIRHIVICGLRWCRSVTALCSRLPQE